MNISTLSLEDLKKLASLLNLSARYTVSIEEEIDYYDPEAAKTWFQYQDSSGNTLGFIRQFKQGSDWSIGEIYVNASVSDRKRMALELLKAFNTNIKFPASHRLRFDIWANDEVLNQAIIEFGFSQSQQNFLQYELTVQPQKTHFTKLNPHPSKAKEIAHVLSFLNPVSEQDVIDWIKSNCIRVFEHNSQIVSAAQISINDDDLEIIRIATHQKFLRQGFAKQLILSLIEEAAELAKSKISLKVEDKKLPAIATYTNLGFVEVKEKSQVWHSKLF